MIKKVKLVSAILISVMMLTALFTGCSGSNNDIVVVSREDGSGTRGAFIELTGIQEKDTSGNKVDKTTEEATVVNSTSVVLTSVAGNKNAIGYISLGSLNDTVKAVNVDGATATIDNIKSGTYKVFRPFNIATKANPNELVQDFISFILSSDGQAIVEDNGYISSSDAGAYNGTKPVGKIVVGGSSSVTPVIEKLKEAYLEVNTKAQIEVQLSDSTTGMNAAAEGTVDIGMASREMKDSEKEKLEGTVIALDGIAVIINKNNSVSNVTMDQIKDIFTGAITSWDDVK